MKTDLWTFEKALTEKGFTHIAGVDEAGRGPLAGPVVSAAVVLPPGYDLPGLNDSKQLTPRRREIQYVRIYAEAVAIGIGIVDPPEIDRLNILQASRLSMAIAVQNLSPAPDYILIDGNQTIASSLPQQAIVKIA